MASYMVIFGWCFVVAMIAAILIPYLLGKSDLLTSWNLFLLGSINFVGCGAVAAGRSIYRLGWYNDDDRLKFILGALVCYFALFASYYLLRFPRKLAGRHLNKWPAVWGIPLFVLVACCLALTLGAIFVPNVQGLGQTLAVVGTTAPLLIAAYVFMLWLDRPDRAMLVPLLIAATLLALFVSTRQTISRRGLLGVLLLFAICLYWLRLRYARPGKSLAIIGAAGLGIMILVAGWTAIRFRLRSESFTERMIAVLSSSQQEGGKALGLFDGDAAVECSCIAIHRYTKDMPPQPFFTFKYVLSNPIPRAFWPDKPEALGQTLPRDIGVWKRGYVNWGPGIVGHGFHEGGAVGGYFMLAFYGVLFGGIMRFFDELLARQPNNPYLIAVLGGASANIIAFSRGDIGYFTVVIIGAVLTGLVVPLIIRVFTGTGFRYLREGETEPVGVDSMQPQIEPDPQYA